MKISLNWLKEFVEIPQDMTPRELGEDLTLRVAEVEEVLDQAKAYDKMVVGVVKEIQSHPDSNKLKVCSVDVGQAGISKFQEINSKQISSSNDQNSEYKKLQAPNSKLQIVCGGVNLQAGMKVVVALPGARVRWHGEGDVVELKKAKIRGTESQGMILAAKEPPLEIPKDKLQNPDETGEATIMNLKTEFKPGSSLAESLDLNDVVIDIDNKSITNRPDLWGHRGLAREISAMYGIKFQRQSEIQNLRKATSRGRQNAKVKIEEENNLKVKIEAKDLCRRFTAVKMDNIKVDESPAWLQQRLSAIGQRSINNLVDISNYVMFELGQPTHIFDVSKLKAQSSKLKSKEGVSLLVRKAKPEEILQTLDGEVRKLDTDMLVIADKEKPIGIAGVIGGANSEVDENTSSIIIEAANFAAVSIRQTSQKLGLRTEASARFEKGLDPHLAEEASQLVIQLVTEIIPGAEAVSPLVDIGDWEGQNIKIETELEFIQKRLGVRVTLKEVQKILTSLGFGVSTVDNQIVILVPSWRGDVMIPEDIVEEVGRIYGYNKLPSYLPTTTIKADDQTNVNLSFERSVKNYLTMSAGLREVENYVFDFPAISEKLGIDLGNRVEIANPSAAGQEFLRQSLLPLMVKNIKDNLRFYDKFGLFEIGRIYRTNVSLEFKKFQDSTEALPDQPRRLAALLVDKNSAKTEVFYQAKGIIAGLLKNLRIEFDWQAEDKHPWLESGFELNMLVNNRPLGELGLLNPVAAGAQKIDQPVGVIYLDYDYLMEQGVKELGFKSLPEFPAVVRDLAVIVDHNIKYEAIDTSIKQSSKLLETTELFDVYEGEQIDVGQRSLAWHLSFRDPHKTLTSEEAEKELEKIIKDLRNSFNAKLRS